MEPDWWADLEVPWRVCLELAWEAFAKSTVPVGAVVVDAAGTIVSTGRNRQRESAAPSPQIAGSNLAHAEINALIALPRGYYSDHTLYSTLQPCLLCTGAICHSHIGTVRFAAADPIFAGIERLPELNAHVARRWPQWHGPLDSPVALWSSLLTFVFAIRDDASLVSRMSAQSDDASRQVGAVVALAGSLEACAGRPFAEVLEVERVGELFDVFSDLVSGWWPKPPGPVR